MSELENHDHLIWTETGRRALLDTPIFRVSSARRRADDGKESDYMLVDCPDWCNVIAPFTRHDGVSCFVMARQYRHGSRTVSVEFPGGLVDEGESPAEAALRELEEETGFTAARLRLIGQANPNPAFMENTVFTYVAEGVGQDRGQSLDENERLDAILVPVDEITGFVRPDFHLHAIMMNALHWYSLFRVDGLEYRDRLERWRARRSDLPPGDCSEL